MKRVILVLLALLMLLPLARAEELEMEISSNYITFPALDEMKAYFRKSSEWTIVHRGNMEEHMELLLQRGDSEADIRARFAEDTLLWEAYKTHMPEDACIRMECFEDAFTREVWHLKHFSTAERKEYLQLVNDSQLFTQYDTFAAKFAGDGGNAYVDCGFTTVPPAAYESGKMYVRYINGREYVMTYAVRGRMAGRSKLRSKKENEIITGYSPFNTLKFGAKLQPQMPSFELDEAFPAQVDLGETKITGKIAKGAKMKVTLDDEEVSCKVTSKGAFTAVLPVEEAGEHEVSITVTQKSRTERVETFTLHASADRTPLSFTTLPEELALAGKHTIAGISEPGAEIVLRLDGREAVTLTADAEGRFSHEYEIMDDQAHLLYAMALAQGKDASVAEYAFITEYETFKDGLKAFEKQLTEHTISQMAEDPKTYIGQRVKISVKTKAVTYTEEGLGILCTYNPPKGSKHAKTPLYLTLYGYGQDQIQPDMTITIYGTVNGQRQVEDEQRLDILVQYGTYLVTK